MVEIVRAPLLGRIPGAATYAAAALITALGCAVTFAIFRRCRGRIAYWS
jgi:ABC-type polysaccharide/polyol phosphate export permease